MTQAGTAAGFGVEWASQSIGDQPHGTGWPPLTAAERCDGENPMTGKPCINGHHKGYHRDSSGAEWLDD